ncbi:MAG: hypothetical protein JMN24_08035, partial [gamma proteobacterium endosymbiont of Lamellibrachia anaximandri]|nr:hypothetical protein [gamma proteobacterium endosymbiont of Lamellibrachia anaximandri]
MSSHPPKADRSDIWVSRLRDHAKRMGEGRGLVVEGRLTRMVGLTLESVGCRAAIGGQCDVVSSNGTHIEAEVVGFGEESLYLMPTGDIRGLEQGARVIPTGSVCEAQVSLRPRERFWDIPVPKIDSAFDSLFVPRPSRSLALRDNLAS